MVRPSTYTLQQARPARARVPQLFANKAVEAFSAKSSTPISLKHLINFGKHGRNKGEKEEAEKLIKGGNFLRTELPTRLSHRLRDLQSLPYIVASHPLLEHVTELYLQAFESIRKFPPIKDLDDNDRFCAFMQGTLDAHQIVIPELAIGMAEAPPSHLPPPALDNFMTRMLRSRISRRVITEQHIALTAQFQESRGKGKGKASKDDEAHVGIVDPHLNAADVVRKCISLIQSRGGPAATIPVIMEGELDTTFAYIHEQLEFMLFELIKSAAHGTLAAHGDDAPNHPIRVTLVHGAKFVAVRVSDEGGGIPPWGGVEPLPEDEVFNASPLAPALVAQRTEIFSFSHMRRMHLHHKAEESLQSNRGILALHNVGRLAGTVEEQVARTNWERENSTDSNEVIDAHLESGIGLPLARMFAEYFGGTLEMFTILGHGTDAVLKVSKFGNAQ